jgi:hypothetical protein
MSEPETKSKITDAEADRINHQAKVDAIVRVLREWPQRRWTEGVVAVQVMEALQGVQYVAADDCEAETPYGPCAQDWGHEGPHYTYDPFDPARPNGTHPWDY